MYSMMHINDIIIQIVIIRFSEDSMSLFIISCRSSDTYNLPDPIDMVAHQYWQASPTHHNVEMDSLIRCWHAGNGDLLSTRKCGCNFNSVIFFTHFKEWYILHYHKIVLKCIPLNTFDDQHWFRWSIASNKPLRKPVLTQIYDAIWHC